MSGDDNGSPNTRVGRIEGRLIALERQVGEIRSDVKSLLARDARRDGAEAAEDKNTQRRDHRQTLIAGAVGGGVTLALQVTARKLGLIQ